MQNTDKLEQLKQSLLSYQAGGACIAFSGGVDSTVILKCAVDTGVPVLAVTFETFLHPHGDLAEAAALAEGIGAEHLVIEINEMDNPKVLENPPDRCYYCKHMLFETLCDVAAKRGFRFVLDGTNADDLKEYRPGLRALKELDVHSPLADLGITKSEVREFAARLGLTVASKPSAPCLATRLPYGQHLDNTLLRRIDDAEHFLKSEGFDIVRVRVHQNLARIEVPKNRFSDFMEKEEKIAASFKRFGFDYITLDMEGFRSGSMDIHCKEVETI